MEHPFEHLTDAQIEHYGDRTSGEGPNQNRLELDQAIETHLADCAGCRTRVLEFHRARLGLMSHPVLSAASSSDPGNSSYQNPPTPDCPTEDALRDLAAGLTASADSLSMTQHAAQCTHCGPILRAYTEDFSDTLSSEDATALQQLNSSSPSWQKKVAQQMAAGVSPVAASPASSPAAARESSPKSAVAQAPSPVHGSTKEIRPKSAFRLPSLKWILAPTALAATAVIAFFIWSAQRETPDKVAKLLAQAYTEQRTMEMRIPYAEHADFKQTRGETGSLLNSPEPLRKATDVIAANLKKNPDDPTWILLSARLNLLDWQYKAALSDLERVTDTQIIESPEFLLTKSLAFYQESEVSKESQGYFLAVDLLSRALQKTPDDPVLLFNRAIACEEIHSYECAISDWNRVLAIDKDPNWTAEARKHLDQINEKKNLAP